MKCPRCGANLPNGATNCGSCGARFSMGKRCPHCQSVIPSQAAVCPKCGKPVAVAAANGTPQNNKPKNQPKGSFRWWRIPIYIVVFAIGVGVGVAYTRQSIRSAISTAFKDSLSSATHSSESSDTPTKQTSSQAAPASGDSGVLGDYEVSILEARTASDYEGKPAIIVGYQFTNNSDENQKFMVAVHGQAFQNGVQLESAILAGSAENYKGDNYLKDVQPGATLEVEQAYLLQDETSEVTVEVSELISFSKDKLTKKFPLS